LAPIRIALVRLPRILEEIATHVLDPEPDLEIVDTIATTTPGLADRIASARADVVLLGSNDAVLAAELLEECPGVTVIAVAGEDQSAWFYAAERAPVSLGALSASALVRAVRESRMRKAEGDRN
jgi:DNA-binding NarL/FixJ family response regulator